MNIKQSTIHNERKIIKATTLGGRQAFYSRFLGWTTNEEEATVFPMFGKNNVHDALFQVKKDSAKKASRLGINRWN